ncbi:MAG: hypothetical protein KDC48_12840, partial [Planctomycetes bacterium]|nr:hypothetical protein [Planctomycetota bacterium]
SAGRAGNNTGEQGQLAGTRPAGLGRNEEEWMVGATAVSRALERGVAGLVPAGGFFFGAGAGAAAASSPLLSLLVLLLNPVSSAAAGSASAVLLLRFCFVTDG